MPEQDPRRRPDLLPLIGAVIVLVLLLGGYFIFPALHRVLSYQDCIASGRITGC